MVKVLVFKKSWLKSVSAFAISQLQDAVAFVRNNSHRRWWKEAEYREEMPDYPERAVTEVICNAIIHRDYMELGSEKPNCKRRRSQKWRLENLGR